MSQQGYEGAGVRGQGDALSAVERHLGPTLGLPAGTELLTRFGQYASVMKLSDDLAIAFSTDGVGSKTIVASLMDRYDTIGFDCVAMNVNDVICVGAKPVAMVDYLGVNTLDGRRADEILRGLGAAAKEAGIAIPGGELAQLPEVIGSDGRSPGDATAFDLVGTCIGTVHPDCVVLGASIRPGDALIGLDSSGIHSNGVTLARKVLMKDAAMPLDSEVAPGRTLGDELLEPTEIYVRAVIDLWSEGIETRGLVHVTSDGFANLCRLEAEVGYRIDSLPDTPLIFQLIRETGSIPNAEMYRVFNMGVGFVVVVPEASAQQALERIERSGYSARRIGTVTGRKGVVEIEPVGLEGTLVSGESSFRDV
jgi:phosphoribosylformylglycinamidine cyclo-ligase